MNAEKKSIQKHERVYINQFTENLQYFMRGFYDALNLADVVQLFTRSKRLQKLFAQCFLLNGGIFLGSVIFLDFFANPIVEKQLGHENRSAWYSTFANLLFASMKNLLWIYPMYTLSMVLSTFWYNDIAEIAFKLSYKPKQTSITYKRFISSIVWTIYKSMLLLYFMIQSSIVALIPFIGMPASFILTAWLYAFYSFDYVWDNTKNMSVQQRLDYFETHWAYMFGFGNYFSKINIRCTKCFNIILFPIFYKFRNMGNVISNFYCISNKG
jgi:etoposide-induced 2.4 mRNA